MSIERPQSWFEPDVEEPEFDSVEYEKMLAAFMRGQNLELDFETFYQNY